MVIPERKDAVIGGLIGIKAFSGSLFAEVQESDFQQEVTIEATPEKIEEWVLGLIELHQICGSSDEELGATRLLRSIVSKEDQGEIVTSTARLVTTIATQTRDVFFPGMKDCDFLIAYFNSAINYELSKKVPKEQAIKLELTLADAKVLTENIIFHLLDLTFTQQNLPDGEERTRHIIAGELSLEGLADVATQLRNQGLPIDSDMLGHFQGGVNTIDTMRRIGG